MRAARKRAAASREDLLSRSAKVIALRSIALEKRSAALLARAEGWR